MRILKNILQVSTPIFYVNGAPHLGHLHSVTLADAIHRAHKLLHPSGKIIFSTGTDEHGLKIQQAAEKSNQNPKLFCDAVSSKFKELFDTSCIDYTDFIRTTEDRHKLAVSSFWTRLMNNGCIYKSAYKGWYCTSDETFVTNSQILEIKNGDEVVKVSSESMQPVEWMEEENYMFSLSRFEKDLLHWLDGDCVKPDKFATILKNQIREGLPDLSVSRQRSRLKWGIPVPHDDTHTIYVWLDALVNYLTVGGYPISEPNCDSVFHVIGKDILKFHGIYWPALLMAGGLSPPGTILCHSHWTVDHEKMSKSKGNIVEPKALIEKFGVDGTRYFLLREAVPHSNANFNEDKMTRVVNSELADTLGNLLSRCTAKNINKKQIFPKYTRTKTISKDDLEIAKEARQLCDDFPGFVFDGNIYRGLEHLMELLRKTNNYVQVKEPWSLAKSPGLESDIELGNVLYIALESVRACAVLLQPIIPDISDRILNKLSCTREERQWYNLKVFQELELDVDGHEGLQGGRQLQTGSTVVFPRIRAK